MKYPALSLVLAAVTMTPSFAETTPEKAPTLEMAKAKDAQARLLDRADAIGEKADVHYYAEEYTPALRLYYAQDKLLQLGLKQSGGNAEWQKHRDIVWTDICMTLQEMERYDEALKAAETYRAVTIAAKPAYDDPLDWQSSLGEVDALVGDIYSDLDKKPEAHAAYLAALKVQTSLVNIQPDNATWLDRLNITHYNVGDLYSIEGKKREALIHFEKSLALTLHIMTLEPGDYDMLAEALDAYMTTHELLTDISQGPMQKPASGNAGVTAQDIALHRRDLIAATARGMAIDPRDIDAFQACQEVLYTLLEMEPTDKVLQALVIKHHLAIAKDLKIVAPYNKATFGIMAGLKEQGQLSAELATIFAGFATLP